MAFHRVTFRHELRSSIFLEPFAPPALPGFVATMAPLTPAGQVVAPDRSHCFMYRIFRPFRLQSPSVAPTAWPVFHSRTYRRNRSEERVPPTKQGYAGVSWASPWDCWLAATIGRIEFVILRTSRSPPDALHLPSRGRSFDRLRQPGRPPTGTRTLLVQYTCNRTAPGGSRWDDAPHPDRRR